MPYFFSYFVLLIFLELLYLFMIKACLSFGEAVSQPLSVAAAFAGAALRQSARQPEVTNLDVALLINQNIGRLQVSMNNVLGMEEPHGAEQVVNYQIDVFWRHLKFSVLGEKAPQVCIHEFHHYENAAAGALYLGLIFR